MNLLPWIEEVSDLPVLDSEIITEKVKAFYTHGKIDSQGVVPSDFASVLAPAAKVFQ